VSKKTEQYLNGELFYYAGQDRGNMGKIYVELNNNPFSMHLPYLTKQNHFAILHTSSMMMVKRGCMGSMLVTLLYCVWLKGKVRGTFEIYIMHIIRLEIVKSKGYI